MQIRQEVSPIGPALPPLRKDHARRLQEPLQEEPLQELFKSVHGFMVSKISSSLDETA